MALVDSLLSAMVRANGDALVMHVGERPYVVTEGGTLDLSTTALNLGAMTGMLQQLLPADAQNSLEEFGAVEHKLPSLGDDRFTVVAARGGDDIWIEIRRRRGTPAVAVAAPVVLAPVVAAPVEATPVEVEPVEAAPVEAAPVEVAPPVVETPVEAPPLEIPVAAAAPLEIPSELPPLEIPVEASAPPIEAVAASESDYVLEIPADSGPLEIPVEAPLLEPVVEAAVVEPVAPVAEVVPSLEELLPEPEPEVVTHSEFVQEPDRIPVSIDDLLPEPELVAQADSIEVIASEETPEIAEAPLPAFVVPMAETSGASGASGASTWEAFVQPIEPAQIAAPVEPTQVTETFAPAALAVPEPAAPPALEVAETPAAPEAPEAPASPAVVLPMTRTVRIEVPSRQLPHSRASTIERLLRIAAARAASSLYLTSDSRPYIRVEGDMRLLDGEALLSKAEVEAAVMEIVPEEAQEAVGRGEATEWIAELPELGRIRCTSFQDHRGPGVVFRMIATRAATAEQLGFSREVQALATEPEGLVLVAGPRGSGKSTMMSALVDLVNRQRAEYVITLERQIRLVHDNRTALVSQREIRGGADAALSAARAALRENPDVLVVDDLSSAQMVPLLLEAAADGLLVFVSITAPSTADAVERFVELAPAEMRTSMQTAMAETFRGAVSQVLLKKSGGGRVAAREVMLGTAAVTRLIGDGQLGQLPLALESGRRHGMVPITDVLVGLVQTGVVDVREAFRKTHDRERLLAGLKREGVDTSVVDRLA